MEGSRPDCKFTWDTFANGYHGTNGFKFKARFDRCYVRGVSLGVTRFELMGNRPVDGRRGDYLSDHYGLVVGLDVLGNIKRDDEDDEEEEAGENRAVEQAGGKMTRIASEQKSPDTSRLAVFGRPNNAWSDV